MTERFSPDAPAERDWHFAWDLNLGHALIVLTMIASVFLAYTDLRSTEAVHDVRITALERQQNDNQTQLRDVMREIREKLDKIQGSLAEKQDRPR
jgi:hypothetical protein